jgi:uncharacterized membrane protein
MSCYNMKKIILPLFLLLPLLTSCLKDEKSILIFDIKSDSTALEKSEDKEEEDDFSFTNSPATFENVSRHIFQDKCVRCHSSKFAELGVDLSQYKTVFDMSDFFSPVVTEGDPENSGVFLEVESGRMPPKEPLSDEEIAFIKKWIEEGALE